MNIFFDQLIRRFSLQKLDDNPILIKIQVCLRDIAKHYNYDQRFKIGRPSYVFIMLVFLAILITIVKLFQSLILITFVIWKSFITLKTSQSKKSLTLELKNWMFFGLLLLFHPFLKIIDLIPPFIQLFIYNIPWFQNSKYTIQFFDLINQILPEKTKLWLQLQKQEQENINDNYRQILEAQKMNRTHLRF